MSVEDKNKGVTRRSIVHGAAWSVPVVAAAATIPMAAASVDNASLAWTGNTTGLLTLRLLSGGGTLTAQALTTVPTDFTITNGPGAINETANVTIVVGRPGGINIPVGRARGFGVATLNGVDVAPQNTVAYQSAPVVGQFGFPITTFNGTMPVQIDSNGQFNVPVEFGLSGSSTGVSISVLASFPVTLTVDFGNGNVYTANSSISVPVGAGLL